MKAYPFGADMGGWEACIRVANDSITGRRDVSGYAHLDKYLTRHAEIHTN